MKITDDPVIIEQKFNQSIGVVWNAITDVDEMTKWFFEEIPSFKPEVGFETQFVIKVEDRTYLHLWKVTEVIPEKKITYNWKYDGYQGDSFVTFELVEQNNQTTLTLSLEIIEDFQANIPEFSRESAVGGWSYFIKERLKDYLNSEKA